MYKHHFRLSSTPDDDDVLVVYKQGRQGILGLTCLSKAIQPLHLQRQCSSLRPASMQAAASRKPSGLLYDGVLILRPNGFVSCSAAASSSPKWVVADYLRVVMRHTQTAVRFFVVAILSSHFCQEKTGEAPSIGRIDGPLLQYRLNTLVVQAARTIQTLKRSIRSA